MAEVLKYPLTPTPLSLSHTDGSMLKSPKSALMTCLETQIITLPPNSIDVTVLDAMFILHLQSNLPETFGGVARYLLKYIVGNAGNEVHFVTDKWITPSIKDCERDKRGSSSLSYQINGANQKRPSNWLQALRNSTFKKSLVRFLSKVWAEDSFAEILGNKVLYVNSENNCTTYRALNGVMYTEEAYHLYCSHEEADTRMFFLACINTTT